MTQFSVICAAQGNSQVFNATLSAAMLRTCAIRSPNFPADIGQQGYYFDIMRRHRPREPLRNTRRRGAGIIGCQ
jgi:hypothetical protein